MKTIALTLTLSILGLGWTTAAPAAEPAPASPHPDSGGWTELFTGDLSDANAPEGVWSCRDGVLTATQDQCIWSKKSFDNFILDLEFKTAPGTNSGVIVYCSDLGNWIPNSVEIQIADDYSDKWAKMPTTWQCAAAFGHLAAKQQRVVKKPGEWNRMTITCKDKMITVALNEKVVTEMDMSLWTSAKKNPDGSDIPPWLSKPLAEVPTQGHVGLQGKHAGAPIYFRNVKVKELD